MQIIFEHSTDVEKSREARRKAMEVIFAAYPLAQAVRDLAERENKERVEPEIDPPQDTTRPERSDTVDEYPSHQISAE